MNRRSPFLRRLKLVLRNPLTNLVVGIVTAGIFFWLSTNGVQPVYLATEPIQASDTDTAFELFKSTPQTEKCTTRVAFWNHGNTPLTQGLLTAADPLRIVSSKPVRIVHITPTTTSRPTLRFAFDTGLPSDQPVQDISMTIMDGDALDPLDGGVFKIDFIGSCHTQFRVFGRVIGAGRIKYRGESTRTWKYWYATPFIIPTLTFLTIGLTVILLLGSRSARENLSVGWPIVVIMWVVLGFVLAGQPFRQPPWLPEFDLVLDGYHNNY
jgi:hypothetical protein